MNMGSWVLVSKFNSFYTSDKLCNLYDRILYMYYVYASYIYIYIYIVALIVKQH